MHRTTTDIAAVAERVSQGRERILAEIRKVIVGQDEVIDQVLMAIFTGGHCLITGVPGLAKTLLIKTVAQILDLSFKRIQFTPDLMPADITGTEVLDEQDGHRSLRFVKGPIFAQILLADEINRTPPKTQAALLEAMQEYHVTAAGRTLSARTTVLRARHAEPDRARRHLPAARGAARSLHVQHRDDVPLGGRGSPGRHDDDRRRDARSGACLQRRRISSRSSISCGRSSWRRRWRGTPCGWWMPRVPGRQSDHQFIRDWVKWGAGLRASQALILAGKARALIHGRYHVSVADIQALARPVLRHRVIPNFYAESERVSADNLVDRLLEAVPLPRSGM